MSPTPSGRRISQASYQRQTWWQAEHSEQADYSSTLKLKAMFSSETSVNFQRITRLYIPKIELFYLPIVRITQNTYIHSVAECRVFTAKTIVYRVITVL
jgi:sortase (surface protein transpeptidase)